MRWSITRRRACAASDKLTLSFTTLYDNSKDVRTFTAQREESSVQLSERLRKSITFLYRYTYRHVTVDQSTLKISPLLIPLFSQPDRVGEARLEHDPGPARRSDRDAQGHLQHHRHRGWRRGRSAPRSTFGRFLGRNATYHPLGKKYVLARATSFGIMHPLHDVSRIRSRRFRCPSTSSPAAPPPSAASPICRPGRAT